MIIYLCPNCKNRIESGDTCTHCGTKIILPAQPTQQPAAGQIPAQPIQQPAAGQIKAQPKPKKKSRGKAAIGIIAVLLVVVILTTSIIGGIEVSFALNDITDGFIPVAIPKLHIEELEPEELIAGEALGVSDREQAKFQKFAKKMYKAFRSRCTKEERREVKELDNLLWAIATNQLIYEKGGSEADFIELPEVKYLSKVDMKDTLSQMGICIEEDDDSTLFGWLSPMQVYASEGKGENLPQADEVKTRYSDLMYACASAVAATGHTDFAIAMASLAAQGCPLNASAANLIANGVRDRGCYEEAFTVLQYALRLAPGNQAILYNMGLCCLELDRKWAANTYFNDILRINPDSGAAYQGKMLVYASEGDRYNAMIYMIEGARNGYSDCVTEVYQNLRFDYDYYTDLAPKVFENYSMADLTRFIRTSAIFDNTLDTPGQQLEIKKDIILPSDMGDAIASIDSLVVNVKDWVNGYKNEYGEDIREGIELIGKLDDIFNSDGSIDYEAAIKIGLENMDLSGFGPDGKVEADYIIEVDYQCEVFWINILTDYLKVKAEENIEKYIEEPSDKYTELYSEMFDETADEFFKEWETKMEYVTALDPSSPEALLATASVMIQYMGEVEKYGAMTGSYSPDFEEAITGMLLAVNKELIKGYKEIAILLEEYWLYTNNILSYIGDVKNYNECRALQRSTVIDCVFEYDVSMAMGYVGSVMMLITVPAYYPPPSKGNSKCSLPPFPDMPITGMGNNVSEFRLKIDDVKHEITGFGYSVDPQGNEKEKEYATLDELQQELYGQCYDPNAGSGFEDSPKPEEQPKPEAPKPEEPEITKTLRTKIYLGPCTVEYGEDHFSIGTPFIGLTKDKKTEDMRFFFGFAPGFGYLSSGVDFSIGAEIVINKDGKYQGSNIKMSGSAQIVDNGISLGRQKDLVTGLKTDKVSAILVGMESSQSIPVKKSSDK